jgi:hypothetical protein
MQLFIVVKRATYDHGVCGVFSSESLAKAAADTFAENDRDRYHSYEVLPYALNIHVEQNNGEVNSPDSIYSTPNKPEFSPPEISYVCAGKYEGRNWVLVEHSSYSFEPTCYALTMPHNAKLFNVAEAAFDFAKHHLTPLRLGEVVILKVAPLNGRFIAVERMEWCALP